MLTNLSTIINFNISLVFVFSLPMTCLSICFIRRSTLSSSWENLGSHETHCLGASSFVQQEEEDVGE